MRTIELRGDERLEKLITEILASSQEELIVLFGKTSKTDSGLIFLVKDINLADEGFITRSYLGLKWDARLTAHWIEKAETEGYGIALIHAHGNRGKVGFSTTDIETKNRILEHFNTYLQNVASGYLIVGLDDFFGEFIYNSEFLALSCIKSVGCPIFTRKKPNEEEFTPSLNHHRQELALGKIASQILRNTTIAVVGLGGAGSMVVQQLAHLKVGSIILIDGDKVDPSNLSRMVGTTSGDSGVLKTDLAERLIRSVDSSIRIMKMSNYLPTPDIYQKLKMADLIISCVDRISARTALNNFTKRHLIPLVDVGVTIRRKELGIENINGQVIRINPSSRCLKCFGIISLSLESKEAIENYGTGITNPQVITYNGVLASIAVGEMLKVVTGIAGFDDQSANLAFNGLTGEIERVQSSSYVCDVCKTQYAQGDPVRGA